MRLLEYGFTVKYRKGAKHQAVDAQSSLETAGGDVREIDEDLPGILCLFKHEDEIDLDGIYDKAHPYAKVVSSMRAVTIRTRSQSQNAEESNVLTAHAMPQA